MSDSLNREIKEFIDNRIQEAYQEIKDEPEFKQVRMECLRLQDHIIESLPSDGERDTFLQYCELVNQRSSIMEERIYRTGFRDGLHLVREAVDSDS